MSANMTELYTMMRYLQHGTLRQKGLTHFDQWASTFGETTTAIELAPEGTGYRARTRLSYVSCRLRHNTSNRRWRRSDRLMFSPPFRCSLPPMVNSKVFSPGTHKKKSFGNFYMDWILALYDLRKPECGGIQISKEAHSIGKKQEISTQNDKINRQIA